MRYISHRESEKYKFCLMILISIFASKVAGLSGDLRRNFDVAEEYHTLLRLRCQLTIRASYSWLLEHHNRLLYWLAQLVDVMMRLEHHNRKIDPTVTHRRYHSRQTRRRMYWIVFSRIKIWFRYKICNCISSYNDRTKFEVVKLFKLAFHYLEKLCMVK